MMKKKMNRLVCLFICLVLMAFHMTGCSVEEGALEETAEELASAPEKTPETEKEEKSNEAEKAGYTLSDEVIVDDENCRFTIKKAEDSGIWGFTIKVSCENKTADQTLMFSLDNVSVNGYMSDPFWATEVSAGKIANEEILFGKIVCADSIQTADEIRFTLFVYDADDWDAAHLVEEAFAVYPTGLDAESVIYPSRTESETEKVIVDNAYCTFILLEQSETLGGKELCCYLENKSDKKLTFTWDEVSVNGFMIDPFWAATVMPGMRRYSSIVFGDTELEENGVEALEDVAFLLRVYNGDDWMEDDLVRETGSYEP